MLFDPDRVLIESDRYAACKARDISNLCREGHFQVIASQMFALFLLYLLLLEHELHCCFADCSSCVNMPAVCKCVLHVFTRQYAMLYVYEYKEWRIVLRTLPLGFTVDKWQLGGPKCGTSQCSGSPRAPERQVCGAYLCIVTIEISHIVLSLFPWPPWIWSYNILDCKILLHSPRAFLLHLSDMISRVGVTSSSHLKLINNWR